MRIKRTECNRCAAPFTLDNRVPVHRTLKDGSTTTYYRTFCTDCRRAEEYLRASQRVAKPQGPRGPHKPKEFEAGTPPRVQHPHYRQWLMEMYQLVRGEGQGIA